MLNVLTLPILITFLISGCASTSQLEIFKTEVERIPLDIELPSVEVMEEINYLIVTEANQEEVFAKLKEYEMIRVEKFDKQLFVETALNLFYFLASECISNEIQKEDLFILREDFRGELK